MREVLGKKLVFQAELATEGETEAAAETVQNAVAEGETQFEAQPPEQLEEAVGSPEDNEKPAAATVQNDEKVKMVLELFNGEVVRVEKQPKTW